MHALEAAAADYPGARRRLLVLNRDAVAAAQAAEIEVQPSYEWLLAATEG